MLLSYVAKQNWETFRCLVGNIRIILGSLCGYNSNRLTQSFSRTDQSHVITPSLVLGHICQIFFPWLSDEFGIGRITILIMGEKRKEKLIFLIVPNRQIESNTLTCCLTKKNAILYTIQ